MRLKLEGLPKYAKLGVPRVPCVLTNKDAAFRGNTCDDESVPGVPRGMPGALYGTPGTPASKEVFLSSPNVDEGGTAGTPGTPQREISGQDPAYWEDDFSLWALEHCLLREGCFGGVKALNDHFGAWCVAQNTVGCMLDTFEALLLDEGFSLEGGMVYGLSLKEDVESALNWPGHQ